MAPQRSTTSPSPATHRSWKSLSRHDSYPPDMLRSSASPALSHEAVEVADDMAGSVPAFLADTHISQLSASSSLSTAESEDRFIDFPDKYTQMRLLAKGSEGIAQLFAHTDSGKLVVAKVIRPSIDLPTEVILLQRTYGCGTIVECLGYKPLCWPRRDVILLEYCSGGDLYHYWEALGPINSSRLSEQCLWRLFGQLANALAFLHEGRGSGWSKEGWEPIVHRDIKLENILIAHISDLTSGRDIQIKLADFGLAVDFKEDDCTLPPGWGTPCFWPPEQTPDNCKATSAGDVWAMGAVVHELAHSFPPIYDPKELFNTDWWKMNAKFIAKQRYPPWHMDARAPRRVLPINLEIANQQQDRRRMRPTPKYSDTLNGIFLGALRSRPDRRNTAANLARRLNVQYRICYNEDILGVEEVEESLEDSVHGAPAAEGVEGAVF